LQSKLRNLLRAALIAAPFAYAQSASADECNDKTTTLEIVACIEKQTASWDAVVEFAYENALRSSGGEVVEAHKQAQELWLRYRDANCKVARLGEGTIAAVDAAECRLRMTKARAAELGADEESSARAQASTMPANREDEHDSSGRHRDDPPDGADPGPARKIREVYALLAADKLDNEHNPIMNARLAKSFFARPFLDLWAKDQECWNGEGTEGAAQMWVGGQDYKISDVRVTVPMGTADYQRVLASVTSFGTEQHWSYEFRRSKGRWLVHDVLLEGRSLSKAMRGGCLR
jgi:uncharacterized protein YecT (DUF1311 family)